MQAVCGVSQVSDLRFDLPYRPRAALGAHVALAPLKGGQEVQGQRGHR